MTRRFMLCAAFLCVGAMAFAQAGVNSAPVPNPALGLNGYQVVPSATLIPFGAAHSCSGLSADQTQAGSQADFNHIFHVPCLDVKSYPVLVARNEVPLVQPQRLWPNAKAEPIPTQWPKVWMEPIPTQWPDMKMEPITGTAKATP